MKNTIFRTKWLVAISERCGWYVLAWGYISARGVCDIVCIDGVISVKNSDRLKCSPKPGQICHQVSLKAISTHSFISPQLFFSHTVLSTIGPQHFKLGFSTS